MSLNLPPGPGSGTLREKIEWMLERPFILAYENIIEPLGDRLRTGVDNFTEEIERRLVDYNRPFIDKMLEAPNLPSFIREPLERVRNPDSQVELAAVVAVVAGILVGIIQGAMGPIARFMSYFVERIVQTGRPDPETLFRMHRRGAFDANLRDSYLDDLGVSDSLKAGFDKVSAMRPGVMELLTLRLRGYLSETDFQARLRQEGVPSEFISDIVNLGKSIPGPGDMVRFALRETWDDSIATKYGYDDDFSLEFEREMERLGYAEDWSEKYWRAHWELPSVQAGFAMLHRGIIDQATLAELLKISDFPAYWRDRLIQLSYNTFTRVDARRMYAAGVLSADEVYESYLSQGYDAEKARKLADFAIADAMSSDRSLTKTDILNGYRDGLLTKDETVELLTAIHFSADTASFLVARVDTQREQKLVAAEVRVIKDLYLHGDSSLTDTEGQLTALGIPARQIELYIQEWTIDRDAKVKRPSRGTLERLYKSGTITQDEFTETLTAIGYQSKYVDWYMHNVALEHQREMDKEEERARKERERVEKDRRKTAYQRAKAEIDVDIAETQAAVAASNVALVEAQGERNEALRAMLPLDERAQIERDYMVIIHAADAAIGQAKIAMANLREQEKVARSRLAELTQSLAMNIDVALQVEIKAAIASMRTTQARARNAIAGIRVEIARLKEAAATEPDAETLEAMALELLGLKVQEAEQQEIITGVGIDLREAEERLGLTMSEVRRSELAVEQTTVKRTIADVTQRIAILQTDIAETATAKQNAKNAMRIQLGELPGEVQALEIRQHYDSLIERIKAQITTLGSTLSQLRVQKALLAFEYRGALG